MDLKHEASQESSRQSPPKPPSHAQILLNLFLAPTPEYGTEETTKTHAVLQRIESLRAYHLGNVFDGCRACRSVEQVAAGTLAPHHNGWAVWIRLAAALACQAKDTSLLISAHSRRKDMLDSGHDGPRLFDILLRICFADAVGLRVGTAIAALQSAFELNKEKSGSSDATAFLNQWFPVERPFGSPFGNRVRIAASVAIGVRPSANQPLEPRTAPAASCDGGSFGRLAEGRTGEEKRAAQQVATGLIQAWEEAERVMHAPPGCSNEIATALLPRSPLLCSLQFTDEDPALLERAWILDDVFNAPLCDRILAAVHDAVATTGGWHINRHGKYPTTDFPLSQVENIEGMVRAKLFKHVLRPLAPLYFPPSHLPELMELSDCFFVKYSAAEGEQRELTTHADGSIFSFNILLNDPTEFDGGGTWFESGGGRVVRLARGSAVGHSGRARHAGMAITRGERYLLVGFVGCASYPYCTAAAEHGESDAFLKFGPTAWGRTPMACLPRDAFSPSSFCCAMDVRAMDVRVTMGTRVA